MHVEREWINLKVSHRPLARRLGVPPWSMPVPIDKRRKNAMPARELQEQLNALREQLEQNPPLSEAERAELHELMQQIELKLELETKTQDSSLADGVNLAVERFELEHPTLAGTLRNIGQALANMGI
jgi:hypothetical protein